MSFEDIKKIADTYGYDSQSRMLIEEMAELTKAINKAWRVFNYCKADTVEDLQAGATAMRESIRNLIEEIADVEIMLAQIKYLMQCNTEVIEVREQKIARQLERIAKTNATDGAKKRKLSAIYIGSFEYEKQYKCPVCFRCFGSCDVERDENGNGYCPRCEAELDGIE